MKWLLRLGETLLMGWWSVTGRWRCQCCGELRGKRCDRYCLLDGCPQGCQNTR